MRLVILASACIVYTFASLQACITFRDAQQVYGIMRKIYREPIAAEPCQGVCELTPELLASYPDGMCPRLGRMLHRSRSADRAARLLRLQA